jgi:hypothetical protein
MPFANLSGDPEQAYFADGMVEEITAALSRSKSLFVIASTSSLSLSGRSLSPAEAGLTARRRRWLPVRGALPAGGGPVPQRGARHAHGGGHFSRGSVPPVSTC